MTSDTAVSWRASIRRPAALWIALAASALLIVIGIVAIAVMDLPDPVGQSQPGSVLPKPASPSLQSPSDPLENEMQTEGTAKQQDQTTQAPATEPAPSGGEKPEVEATEGDQTSIPTPAVPAIAPPPSTSDVSSPAAKAPKAKKPAAPKAQRKDHKKVPSDRWIQTR